MNKILEGAREALAIVRGESHPARTTWFFEFGPDKSARIVITGAFDDEVIDAMQDYLGRQKMRLVNARADAQSVASHSNGDRA